MCGNGPTDLVTVLDDALIEADPSVQPSVQLGAGPTTPDAAEVGALTAHWVLGRLGTIEMTANHLRRRSPDPETAELLLARTVEITAELRDAMLDLARGITPAVIEAPATIETPAAVPATSGRTTTRLAVA